MTSVAHHLAIYNFGLHVAEFDSPEVLGFRLREPLNFAAAEKAEGFIARSGYDGELGPPSWGKQVFPRFIEGSGTDSGPTSLSLWRDVESLMAFSYSGVHAEALKNARNGNRKADWPPLVLWWVAAGHVPQWPEAVQRLECLRDRGLAAENFSFKQPFAADGSPTMIDRKRVKSLARSNAFFQKNLLDEVRRLPV